MGETLQQLPSQKNCTMFWWRWPHLLRLHSQESKLWLVKRQFSELKDISMTSKNSEVDSLLPVHEFRVLVKPHFWSKWAIFWPYFFTFEALSSLLGWPNHWSTLSNVKIIVVSCIEAVNGPGGCQKLGFVDDVIQLLLVAGLGFCQPSTKKTLKMWSGDMIPMRSGHYHGTTDAILKFQWYYIVI